MPVTYATINGTVLQGYAPTDALYSEWFQNATEYNRSLIGEVPGSGAVLGVWVYEDTVYAFRNNASGTAALMWASSVDGWVSVTTPPLLPNGQYRFINYNFYGHPNRAKMYGVDGVNQGFEFDGATFTQIATGMATDTPSHVVAHKYHLFYSFAGGSVQHSSIGDPSTWSPVTGASEIAVGDEITGFATIPGDTLAIFCRNSTYLLYGTSVADWNLKTHSLQAGAIENTVQDMHTPIYLDDYGITSLEQTQAYGDFKSNSYSALIQPLIERYKGSVTASMRVKAKDQYRLFFNDDTGLIAKRKAPNRWDYTRVNLPLTVRCACSLEADDAADYLFFGSDNGYVYRMDSGTSFDGAEIEAILRLPFNHLKSPRGIKSFKKLVVEMVSPDRITLRYTPEFSYGDEDIPASDANDLSVQTGGGYWNSAVWDEFIWSAQSVGVAEAFVFGSGTNLGLVIRSNGIYDQPHTLQSVILHYAVRGMKF